MNCKFAFGWPCGNFACAENIFYAKLKLHNPNETEKTKKIGNCLLNNHEEWSLEDIASAWGFSRERIRQIEDDTIKKIKYSPKLAKDLRIFIRKEGLSNEKRDCRDCMHCKIQKDFLKCSKGQWYMSGKQKQNKIAKLSNDEIRNAKILNRKLFKSARKCEVFESVYDT